MNIRKPSALIMSALITFKADYIGEDLFRKLDRTISDIRNEISKADRNHNPDGDFLADIYYDIQQRIQTANLAKKESEKNQRPTTFTGVLSWLKNPPPKGQKDWDFDWEIETLERLLDVAALAVIFWGNPEKIEELPTDLKPIS